MSEAADAERAIEDMFAEEIMGAAPEPPEPEPDFPVIAPPEPKSVSEAIQLAEDGQEEGTPEEEVAGTPLIDLDLEDDGQTVTLDEEEPYVAWAKKQFGEDIDLDSDTAQKLAKSAYEKEKMLGKKAEETRSLQMEREQRELQEQIDALNAPGNLSREEDTWVDEAVMSGDPSEWARNALEQGRPDLYSSVLDRWSTLGPDEARQARILHGQVLQIIQNQPTAETRQQSYTQALGQTFLDLGLNLETHGTVILQKVEELGSQHPDVIGMMSQDPTVRAMATRHLYDLVASGKTTVAKAKTDDVVSRRVQEESLRQKAAAIENGGPRQQEQKKSTFWESFDEELSERGWDGNRPVYGRD
jgi:hypothetical protein